MDNLDEILDREYKMKFEHNYPPIHVHHKDSEFLALYKRMNIKEYHMQINEYQQLALRTEPPTDNWNERISNGLMGLNGEAGEAIDILKKHLFHKHPLDKEHLAKELGDVAWYIAVSADALGYTLEEIFQMNIDKLKARYPEGFDSERSMHRAEGDI